MTAEPPHPFDRRRSPGWLDRVPSTAGAIATAGATVAAGCVLAAVRLVRSPGTAALEYLSETRLTLLLVFAAAIAAVFAFVGMWSYAARAKRRLLAQTKSTATRYPASPFERPEDG